MFESVYVCVQSECLFESVYVCVQSECMFESVYECVQSECVFVCLCISALFIRMYALLSKV